MSEDNKPKFELPPRLYYTLEQAAMELGCDADYLLHLGATERIELIAKIPDSVRVVSLYEVKHCIEDYFFTHFVSVPSYEIFAIEDEEKAKFCLDLKGGVRYWGNHFSIENVAKFYSHDYSTCCVFIDSEKNMVDVYVTRKHIYLPKQELDRLKQNTPMDAAQIERIARNDNEKKLHRNTEINAAKREKVLRVAMACKNNFPDECKTQVAWANTIDQKWALFYKGESDPPLKLSGIETLLSEVLKIPD